jgi:hypothetical protein
VVHARSSVTPELPSLLPLLFLAHTYPESALAAHHSPFFLTFRPLLSASADEENASLKACLGVAQDLKREVDVFKTQQFADWEQDTQEQLEDMAQWKNSRLMTFDTHNSHIKTHFNEQVSSPQPPSFFPPCFLAL